MGDLAVPVSMGGEMPPPGRPLGISILAAIAAISFVAGLAGLWAILGGAAVIDGGELIVIGFTVASGLAAYGLWNLRQWAWPLTLATWAIGTVQALLLFTENVINSNLVVGPVVIFYLLRPNIRALFRS